MTGPTTASPATLTWDPFHAWPQARPWIWAFLAAFVAAVQGPAFVRSLRPDRGVGVDFFQEWASARNVLNGLPPYENLAEAVHRYLGLDPQAGVHVQVPMNAHPPTSVLVLAPFGYLDYPDAVLAWNLLSLFMLGASLWLIVRAEEISLPAWSVFPVITLLLLCNPFRQQVYLGQLNLALLLLLVGIWVAARNGRSNVAGVLLGVATVFKLFPGFLFMYFALRREWRIVAVGLGTAIALTALTALVLGPDTYRFYVSEVLPGNERSQSGWKNASLSGLWKKLLDPATAEEHIELVVRSPAAVQALRVLSGLALVALLALAIRRARTLRDHDLTYSLAIVAMLLLSPIAWDHYFVMLFLPLALVVLHQPPSRLSQTFFLVLMAALWVDPELWFASFIAGGREGTAWPWQTLTALSFQCYALVGLFAFTLWCGYRREDAKAAQPA